MIIMENRILDDSHMVSPLEKGKHKIACADVPSPFAYCHDSNVGTSNPSWMAEVEDELHMSQLSLPGTHDTMAMYGGDAVQCQSASLYELLLSGVRVLDIRCRHIADIFAIHHGVVFQKCYFGDVLDTIKEFLANYPNETIYMRVKQEHKPDNVTRTFEETFREAYWNVRPRLFWNPKNSENPTNPQLRETRGKIVVLQNFSAHSRYGVPWEQLDVQDAYHLNTNWDLYDKWEKVKAQLHKANASSDSNMTFVNFLSGSGGSFPYFVASGKSSHGTNDPRLLTGRTTPGWKNSWVDFPRVGCFIGICSIAFEGTNILAAERIGKDKDFKHHVGMVIADFPAKDLIERIISLNL